MPEALAKTSAPAAKFVFQDYLLRIRGGEEPAIRKTAVEFTGKLPEKSRSERKAAEPAPKAPGHSTRSRAETALAAGKTKRKRSEKEGRELTFTKRLNTTSKKYQSKLKKRFSPHIRNLGMRVISAESLKTEDLGSLRQNLRGNFETEISNENPKEVHLGTLRHQASEGTD